MKLKTTFWIILMTVLVVSATPKDKPVYKCDLQGTDCTFTNITIDPINYEWQPTAEYPEVVITIDFYYSIIPVVTKDICESFPALRNLNMNDVQIEEILQDAFHACHQLISLSLSINYIKNIPQNAFFYVTSLQKLYLGNNLIMKLDDYKLLSNMPNLTYFAVQENDLTEFSPELIRNNKLLDTLFLDSNDLADVEAEQIIEFLPNLKLFNFDDNEIACTRVIQLVAVLTSNGIATNGVSNSTDRFYPQEYVLEDFICSPDISWMASNYRKQNLDLERQLKRERTLKREKRNTDLNEEIRAENQNVIEGITQRMNKMDKRFDHLEAKLGVIINLIEALNSD